MSILGTVYTISNSIVTGITEYIYDNNGKFIKLITIDPHYGQKDSLTYTWQNGDFEFGTRYQYSNSNNANGNYMQVTSLISEGLNFNLYGLNTSHLLKSLTDNGHVTNLFYNYDSVGNISTIKFNGIGFLTESTISNTYTCK